MQLHRGAEHRAHRFRIHSLQTEIASRLTNAADRPQSVTCKEDLIGRSARPRTVKWR